MEEAELLKERLQAITVCLLISKLSEILIVVGQMLHA